MFFSKSTYAYFKTLKLKSVHFSKKLFNLINALKCQIFNCSIWISLGVKVEFLKYELLNYFILYKKRQKS